MKPRPSSSFERAAFVREIRCAKSVSSLLAVMWITVLPFVSAPGQSLFVSSPEAPFPGSLRGVDRFNLATGAFEVTFASGSIVGIGFGPTGDLFGASFDNGNVSRFDGTTGAFISQISGVEVTRPVGLTVGPDGDIFVSDNARGRVVRYDGRSGAFESVFTSGQTIAGPWHLVFGPDGDLYVASSVTGEILRYDGTTGAFISVFASSGSVQTAFGVAFGPDGNLYVTASTNDPVFRFNGTTGAFMGAFTTGRQLVNADALVFGPDGDLYVANFSSQEVDRFDGTTGAFKAALTNTTVGNPSGIAFTPAAKVLNISTRLAVQTDDNVLIAGFIITGQEPRDVIVRAIGPSLSSAGIDNALANPILELHDGSGASIFANDNWKEAQQAEIEATMLAPTDDLESAIVTRLAPGNYTAVVRGANDTTGVGLAEVYDLNQATPSKLANISTRGFVDTGENVMIGGFIVRPGGGTNTSVILRAIGPSLGSVVDNALADPTLELHDSTGALVSANDNWKDSQQAEIEATGVPPTDDAESALVADLPPGAYTAIVRGKDDTTGVALVELYSLN